MNELWNKNIKGDWCKIFHTNEKSKAYYNDLKINVKDYYPEINKKGWQFAFMMKLNRNKNILDKYNKINELIQNKSMKFDKFKLLILKYLGKNWINDIENIAHFYEKMEECIIKYNDNGTINEIKFNQKIKQRENFNNSILYYFDIRYSNIKIY